MENPNSNDEWSVPAGRSNIKDSSKKAKATNFINQSYTTRAHDLIIALCQISLGLTVVTISILGFIQPLWVATFTSIFASISIMIGLCFLYIKIVKPRDSAELVRRALERVMKFKN